MPIDENDHFKVALAEEELLRQKIRKRYSIEFILKFYFIFGLLAFFGGILYTAYVVLDIELSQEALLGVTVAFSGAVFSVVSTIMMTHYKNRDSRSSLEQTDEIMKLALVSEWMKFEKVARDSSNLNRKDPDYFSIRRLLEGLLTEKRIDEREFRALQTALEIRNRLVHGVDDYSIEAYEVNYVSNLLRKIVSRLEDAKSVEANKK